MDYKLDGKSGKEDHTINKETKGQAASPEAKLIPISKDPKFEVSLHKAVKPTPEEKQDSGKKEQKSENKTGESFTNSVQQGEEAIEAMISTFAKLVEINTDFTSQLISVLQGPPEEYVRKGLDLTRKNFDASIMLAANNTKELSAWFDNHVEQTVAFHKNLTDSFRIQSETMMKMQNKGFEQLTEWASDWWSLSENDTTKS